jgi:tRNA (guanine-N7-)-methyltransferase
MLIRHVRSFVVRSGRITHAQRRALDTLGHQFILPYCPETPVDWPVHFGREAPRILEIGFGMGEATAMTAAQAPDKDFIGIETHIAGIGALLKQIDQHALNNIRIIQHDAVEVVKQMLCPASLDGIHIFFPDPWHKKKHHKRRLIQPDFTTQLALRLKPNAYLHCVTDWQAYAEHMLFVLSAQPLLQNTAHGYAARPAWRPLTKFEARAKIQARSIWELIFKRRQD